LFLASACVTCPSIFVPRGIIVRPSFDLSACVVCAVNLSPTFAFFESNPEFISPRITVPDASATCVCSLRAIGADGSCAAPALPDPHTKMLTPAAIPIASLFDLNFMIGISCKK
jgi:hypothetical protein